MGGGGQGGPGRGRVKGRGGGGGEGNCSWCGSGVGGGEGSSNSFHTTCCLLNYQSSVVQIGVFACILPRLECVHFLSAYSYCSWAEVLIEKDPSVLQIPTIT